MFTKEYWEKRRKKKEAEKAKEAQEREQKHAQFENQLKDVHVDGVEIPMKVQNETEEVGTPTLIQKAPATLSLKLSLAELQIDSLAHAQVIEQTYKAVGNTGLAPHLVQVEAERIAAPHRRRLNDINKVLEQFNE